MIVNNTFGGFILDVFIKNRLRSYFTFFARFTRFARTLPGSHLAHTQLERALGMHSTFQTADWAHTSSESRRPRYQYQDD
jgi:hypothetical protein